MEEEETRNKMYFSPVEEEEQFSEDEESDGSSISTKSEEWPTASAEQHGLKSPRTASKVKTVSRVSELAIMSCNSIVNDTKVLHVISLSNLEIPAYPGSAINPQQTDSAQIQYSFLNKIGQKSIL